MINQRGVTLVFTAKSRTSNYGRIINSRNRSYKTFILKEAIVKLKTRYDMKAKQNNFSQILRSSLEGNRTPI